MSQKGKVESGAQLLARLGSRPSFQGWEATEWLGFQPSPGDILEMFGGEGVGKSELMLNLVASTLLPTTTGGQQHHASHGNQSQAIWVDCDLKFSVLRLAVLLEQRIVRNGKANKEVGDGVGLREKEGESWSSLSNRACVTSSITKREEMTEGHTDPQCGKQHDNEASRRLCFRDDKASCHSNAAATANKSCDETFKTDSSSSTLKRKAQEMERDDTGCSDFNHHFNQQPSNCREQYPSVETIVHKHHKSETLKTVHLQETPTEGEGVGSHSEYDCNELNAEEVEKKVLECLERVQVVRCTSSQQLVCTLHSLESLIAANLRITLLVIDSISAFFWSDKCSDFNNAFLNKTMSHIASVLKKIAKTYSVLVVAAKQALMKPRLKHNVDNVVPPSTARSDENGHVEFLSAAWSGAVTKRLLCSKSVLCQGGVETTHYTLTGADVRKHFTITESGVHFDQK